MNSQYCPFCSDIEVIAENEKAFAVYDKYPVNPGHVLIIPKRHVTDYFETTPAEKEAMHELLEQLRLRLSAEKSPDAFNVGINCGLAAGQTIFHVHMHLIPRYEGDVEDPSGGVRGVIPERQKY
ncbi:HIT family protein [Salisediminibacterium halotolerans]|uniref:Diadenosine tetraphosphate (Ap4A) hydrolase n=1 Tax=Salisediminibacterium halotolerans TaxID=517425 RepID=A0A1H9RCT2_9BACI|nr:HIT family protein [Salisediminibacterium haloalkalitolerans]SER70355.1 Diadenosine tetraphosphate (Ap4A) hydrolase [Salisediminibacterium haloalkalitolerans]